MQENLNRVLYLNKIKYITVFFALAFLLISIIFISIFSGNMDISFSDVFYVLGNKIFGLETDVKANVITVIWNIRLPRIICGGVVGMGLAVSGVIFQGILQNPLADPYTIGISTGASFGASLAIILNLLLGIYFPTVLAGLIGSLLTLILVIFIARKGNGFESANLIIAGIIISSILSSGVSFIKMLSGENVGAIVFWIMGSLSAKCWNDVFVVMPITIICIIISIIFAKKLDIMALGDNSAKALGINTNMVRLTYLIIGSIITAVCVSTCGVIGFIGLIVPHLLRFWITSKNNVLIILSSLFGATLLMFADYLTRVLSNGEIPVGVITTIIGGPFFIFVFTRRKQGGSKNG